MSPRERILAVLRGELPDKIPWTIYEGLLPKTPEAEELIERGLGLVQAVAPYKVERPNVRVSVQRTPDGEIRTFETPVGTLRQVLRRERGYGSLWIREHLVKDVGDYEVLKFIVNDTVYLPNYEAFLEAEGRMGDRGVVMAALERAPFQRIWIEFTGIERLSFDLHENPSPVMGLMEAMAAKCEEMLRIVAESPAELIWCPDNITALIAGPRIFREHLLPYYRRVAELMRPKGKRVIVHMDGLLRSIAREIGEAPVDVVEAFTPPPDGDLPLGEAKRMWGDKVIWLNFPSSVHLEPPDRIREVTESILREALPGGRVLLGVTENIPEGVWRESLRAITETVDRLGRYRSE